ncbi:hypothetical protein [Flavobacterium alkalisoli]|uniref:hypothetical protein n=1 Tax=Flavobacterium alkalisoli TaxID=2602769 RepID=UPI003A8D5A5B
MKKAFLVLSAILFLAVSCKDKEADKETVKKEQAPAKEEKEFKMYEMSQMAALMEQMYVDNMRLRQRIIDGDTIGDFPKHFLKIYMAPMTDETDRDDFFKEHADKFIEAQQRIYIDTVHAKERFNEGVTSCLACHESKCGGPIPRIKKLYIK